MKKLIVLLIITITLSCSSNDVEPIILTEPGFGVLINSTTPFDTDNIETHINENGTFLTIEARLQGMSITLEIGSEEPSAPMLTEQVYSVDSQGSLIANVRYHNGSIVSSTESGFFRQIQITSIDFDSGVVFGNFSAILPGSDESIHLTDGQFVVVFPV